MSTSERKTVKIDCHGEQLDAWIYPAKGVSAGTKAPVVLMAHGLGGIKLMRLDAFCEKFSEAGYVAVAFDYRHFGGSTGQPRGLIDINKQQEDWDTAIEYVSKLDEVDADRIGLFGTSFSGGHVIQLAAKHGLKIKATVSQCPFTDGLASALQVGFMTVPSLLFKGLKDLLWSSRDNPTRVNLVGEPGQVALLNSHDTIPGYMALLPPGMDKLEVESVPARVGLRIPLARPGSYASQVKSPIYFAICAKDTVAPASATLKYAKQAPKGEPKVYEDMGHFDIYVGDAFERATKDYVQFYKAHL